MLMYLFLCLLSGWLECSAVIFRSAVERWTSWREKKQTETDFIKQGDVMELPSLRKLYLLKLFCISEQVQHLSFPCLWCYWSVFKLATFIRSSGRTANQNPWQGFSVSVKDTSAEQMLTASGAWTRTSSRITFFSSSSPLHPTAATHP